MTFSKLAEYGSFYIDSANYKYRQPYPMTHGIGSAIRVRYPIIVELI
jgi:hypothetical protein